MCEERPRALCPADRASRLEAVLEGRPGGWRPGGWGGMGKGGAPWA